MNALASALDYLALGWSVIPVRAREKRPLIAWQGYQQERPSADEVTHWFTRWPDANVGIVTGAVSALVVLDIDPRHGGAESLRALELAHGPLPRTVEARSGGGGRHLYFAHPGGVVHNRVALEPGIDLRGDGGMIVAPPSVHPSGQPYEWVRAPRRTPLAPLPYWLLERVAPSHPPSGRPIAYWRTLLAEGVAEGGRNNAVAALAGHLFWRGVDVQVAIELLLCWNRVRCHPPLDDDEVVRTVESIARLHAGGGR